MQRRHPKKSCRDETPKNSPFNKLAGNSRQLIDPQAVRYLIRQRNLRKGGYPSKPGVASGNWHLLRTRIDTTALYRAFAARIRENIPWKKTGYWYAVTRENFWRVARCGGISRYFARYEELYQRIFWCGYDNSEAVKPIRVHVCCDGQLARHDGWHRLVIAQLLGIPAVAVERQLVHPDAPTTWEDSVLPRRKCA